MKIFPIAFTSSALMLLSGAAAAGSTIHVPQDMATIQEAVDVALAGDVIMVSAGSYRENVTITTSGVSLKGKKATIDGAYTGSCLEITADDVSVSGFDLVNGGTSSAPADGTEGGGLLYTGSGADISKLEVTGCEAFGIKLMGHGQIHDCVVASCYGPGYVVDTDDQAGELVSLKDNEVYRSAVGFALDDGPFLLDRNIASNNTGDGIQATFLAAASDGTPPTATTVSRNKCIGNGGTGLLVNDEVGALTLIEKCDFVNNDVGLDIIGSNVAINQNEIDLNRSGGAFLKTTGASVDDNRVRRNSLVGMVLAAPEGTTDGTNTLTENRLEDNGGDGLHITSGANVINHNSLRDNKGDGVQVVSGVAGTQLIDNVARDNRHDGIDNWGTDTLITGSDCHDNTGADLAGIGDGNGTVDAASGDNEVKDESGLTALQELEFDTLATAP